MTLLKRDRVSLLPYIKENIYGLNPYTDQITGWEINKLNVKDFVWKSKMMNTHLGIALYEVKSLSHKFMFSASQKINAYLAASLPILVSNTKDNINFLSKYKCGIATNLEPKLIAKNMFLAWQRVLREMIQN